MPELLRTKLFIPPVPTDVVARPHLVERLNLGQTRKLSLVIAPAGYGKTTLVTTWLHQLTTANPNTNAVWLSLDESDDDVRRFLTYFTAAICQLDESFSRLEEELSQGLRDEMPATAILIALLNQVVVYGQRAVLVLDDYHEIEDSSIHQAISFWLDNQPPNFHLVITSRAEPPLPLPRMRVRRQVTEIDTEALRFSHDESTDFLVQHMRLDLSDDDVDRLNSMTEGWVASLQLAALSLQDKADPKVVIDTFNGDNRYIVDYLVSEVLQRQPEPIRDFLLQTSILERFSAELCDAVTGQDNSRQLLAALDQARLFLIPLDSRRHWYRYHHLFADCLRAELLRTAPADTPTYHERASRWYDGHGFVGEAVEHAFAAGNSDLATDLIATNARTQIWEQGEAQQLWQWLQQLPEAQVRSRPQLLITNAWLDLELFTDYSQRLDILLSDATALLDAPDAPYSSAENAEMATEIALAYVSLERLRGNLEQAILHCERAVALSRAGNSQLLKAGARGSLAITHFQAGNIATSLEQSAALFDSRGQDDPQRYGRYVFLSYRMDALRLHGDLVQAEQLYHLVEPHLPQQPTAGSAMLAISWAEIQRERNQLDVAIQHLIPAIETLKPQPSMAVVVQTGAIVVAHCLHAQGRGQEAIQLLENTLREFGAGDTYYPSARISATRALLQLRQGDLSAARSWAEASGLHGGDEPTYLLEIDYLVLARVLIADKKLQSAQALLAKLAQETMDAGRFTRSIEVRMLQALTHESSGEREKAMLRLSQAMQLAQSAGFVRIFIDEGDRLIPLLEQIAGRGVAVDYAKKLLHLLGTQTGRQSTPSSEPNSTTSAPDALNLLLNPLTDRELATLRYLATDMTIPEIADQMVVAPSTIRTYVKRIYGKLDVHSRIEAVNRARSLALLA